MIKLRDIERVVESLKNRRILKSDVRGLTDERDSPCLEISMTLDDGRTITVRGEGAISPIRVEQQYP